MTVVKSQHKPGLCLDLACQVETKFSENYTECFEHFWQLGFDTHLADTSNMRGQEIIFMAEFFFWLQNTALPGKTVCDFNLLKDLQGVRLVPPCQRPLEKY